MNNILNKFKNLTPVKILVFSFSLVLSSFVLLTLFIFLLESYYKMTGKLETIVLEVSDFEYSSIVEKNGLLIASDSDPQLILETDMYITNITLDIEYSQYPGEVSFYYATKEGQGFSSNKRAGFSKADETIYKSNLLLPIYTTAIRIDPTDLAGNILTPYSITINENQSFSEYFKITPTRIYYFVLYSLLIASLLGFLKDILVKKQIKN